MIADLVGFITIAIVMQTWLFEKPYIGDSA